LKKESPVFEMKSPKLTAVQEEAAKKLRAFTREAKSSEFLVWAVCGAGKTEVTFPAIADAIQRGQRVLYAVPRRDVVKEIGIRMEQAFPGIRLAVLYGGEGRKEEVSPHLTIATTHQVLRFVDHFHLAILDEADAYPYEGSRMLRYGLRRAIRVQGKLIYLTATPTRELRERSYSGALEFVTIPARHHGYPLPEPVLATDRLVSMVKDDCKFTELLEKFLTKARQEGTPVLIYLPTVEQVEGFGEFLKERGKRLGWNTDWVHAEAAHRDQTVTDFREGSTSILVSSTILERGVNFPGVDVIVVHADHEQVFDAETLVQLAGRAGRFAEKPRGRVVFLGKRISKPMREAQEWIEKMNGEAAEKGLLVKESESSYE
jgi:competence protein ComFA